eukprot:gene515-8028_t
MVQQIVPLPSLVVISPIALLTGLFDKVNTEIEIQTQLIQTNNILTKEKTDNFINDVQKMTTNLLPLETKESLHIKFAIDYYAFSMYNYVIDNCNECLQLNKSNYFAYYLLSLTYGKMWNFKKAVEFSKKAIENYHLMISIEKNPLFEQKIKKLFEMPAEEKKEYIKKYLSSFFEVSNPQLEDDEISNMKKLISFNDLSIFHISNLLHSGYYQDAVYFINQNLQKSNHDKHLIYLLGVSYYFLHQISNAIMAFETSLKNDFYKEKNLLMLIMCYKRLQNNQKVKEFTEELKNVNSKIVVPLCHISLLPDELIHYIFSFLDTKTLFTFGETSTIYSKEIFESTLLNNRTIVIKHDILNPYKSLSDYKLNYVDYRQNLIKILTSSGIKQCRIKFDYLYINCFLKFVLLKLDNKKTLNLIPKANITTPEGSEMEDFMKYVKSDEMTNEDFIEYLKDEELLKSFFQETPNNLIH